jgi:endoglucanase
VLVAAVNWYGFETRNAVAHGLYSRDYDDLLADIAAYGFNTVRIPYSNEMWQSSATVRSSLVSACGECSGKTPREVLALIINGAGAAGLHVILDNHRSSAGNSAESNGMWDRRASPSGCGSTTGRRSNGSCKGG